MAEVETVAAGTETQLPVDEGKSPVDYEARIKQLEEELNQAKAAISRSNSNAADWKRKFNENVDAQKKAEVERLEAEKRDKEELARLRKKERIDGYKEKLIAAGADPASAALMANALPEEVGEEYFTATQSFFADQKKKIESDSLNNQPTLSVGTPPTAANMRTEEDDKFDRWWGLK